MHARVVGVALALAACGRGAAIAGVDDSTFVATMAELRRIQADPSLDSAARASAREAVLQRRGLTPADLTRTARAMADDPERALEVWRAIDARARPGAAGKSPSGPSGARAGAAPRGAPRR